MSRAQRKTVTRSVLPDQTSLFICVGFGLLIGLSLLIFSEIGSKELGSKWLQAFVVGILFLCLIGLAKAKWQLLIISLAVSCVFNIDIFLFRKSFSEIADLHGIQGFQISAAYILLAILFAIWFIKRHPKISVNSTLIILTLLLFIVSLSVVFSLNRRVSLLESYRIMVLVGLSYFVYSNLVNREIIVLLSKVLVLTLIVESVIVFAQYAGFFSGSSTLFGNIDVLSHEMGSSEILRPPGTFGHADKLAVYLTLVTPLAMSKAFTARGMRSNIMYFLCFVVGFAALLLSGARAAWLGFALGVSVQFVALFRIQNLRIKLLKIVTIVFFIVAIASPSILIPRLTKSDMGSAYSRIPMSQNAWEIIKRYPLLGVGPANYPSESWKYAPVTLSEEIVGWPVHNMYLLLASECGIPALLLFLLFIVLVIKRAFRRNLALASDLSSIKYGLGAGVLGFMVASGFNGHYLGEHILFFFLCQLILICDSTLQDNL